MKRETKLGMPALKAEVERTGDPDLKRTYEWSKAVNDAVDEIVFGVPPFPFVRETLEKLAGVADVIVCSATPGKALAEGMGRAQDRRLHAGHLRPGSGEQEGNPRARHQGRLLAAKRGDDRRRPGRHGGRPRRGRAAITRSTQATKTRAGSGFSSRPATGS